MLLTMSYSRHIERAPKQNPLSRCCWVCGRPDGDGFTTMLLGLGYNVPKGGMAHAHPRCVRRVQLKQQKERAALAR